MRRLLSDALEAAARLSHAVGALRRAKRHVSPPPCPPMSNISSFFFFSFSLLRAAFFGASSVLTHIPHTKKKKNKNRPQLNICTSCTLLDGGNGRRETLRQSRRPRPLFLSLSYGGGVDVGNARCAAYYSLRSLHQCPGHNVTF